MLKSNCCNANLEMFDDEIGMGVCTKCREWAEALDDSILSEEFDWNTASFEEQIQVIEQEYKGA